jgi:hypothetical protein
MFGSVPKTNPGAWKRRFHFSPGSENGAGAVVLIAVKLTERGHGLQWYFSKPLMQITALDTLMGNSRFFDGSSR